MEIFLGFDIIDFKRISLGVLLLVLVLIVFFSVYSFEVFVEGVKVICM